MQRYLFRRAFLFVPTMVIASFVVFFIMRALPGNVAYAILGTNEGGLRKQAVEELEQRLGLNDPLPTQYVRWARSMVGPELGGKSLVTGETVRQILGRRFPVTVQLTLLTMFITVVTSIPLGILAALTQDRWPDLVIRVITIVGLAMPGFWVALLVMLGLVLIFTWAPPVMFDNFWEAPGTAFQMMIWPALVLAWGFSSYLVRVTRGQMLEVMQQDYIRTAYSKGLSRARVITRHAVRNALIPVITLVGIQIDQMLSGALIQEAIFGLPGIGQGIVDAATKRDYPVIQSLAMVMVFVVLSVNLIVDMIYVFIDPRIKYG